MTLLFALFLVAHGLIHLIGFAKAFGFAQLPQLTQPVSQTFGVLWLAATLLFLASAWALFAWPRGWWVIGTCAIIVSMVAIAHSWSDARYGALADAVALIGVVVGFLASGPGSLRAEYEHDVDRALSRATAQQPVTEADLEHLPEPVRRYVRASGAVGYPRVHNFRVRMHGRFRGSRDARWFPIRAEQHNFVDEPARFFFLRGAMFGIPAVAYHRYVGPSATMTVRAAALVPVARSSGREMDEGETVTMLNDMCMMAPATLISPSIDWVAVDSRTARATFTNAGHSVSAELTFNERDEMTDFVSDDRYQTSPDGRTATKLRWSTPIEGYRAFGPFRLASGGQARWHDAAGDWAYIDLTIDEVEYNVPSR
ncbi:MAG TPA: DUF6544 family protein [Gemmatimonadaceae bacterium]|nr:DUF6544 family protein [Gemmatimonadaceae bacterium]